MAGLREFLEFGPITMLHQIVIEEVTFLEPLRGQPRSIPIRFVTKFEVSIERWFYEPILYHITGRTYGDRNGLPWNCC
jgi:hypothetical protein